VDDHNSLGNGRHKRFSCYFYKMAWLLMVRTRDCRLRSHLEALPDPGHFLRTCRFAVYRSRVFAVLVLVRLLQTTTDATATVAAAWHFRVLADMFRRTAIVWAAFYPVSSSVYEGNHNFNG
jgi:hypothetical protein